MVKEAFIPNGGEDRRGLRVVCARAARMLRSYCARFQSQHKICSAVENQSVILRNPHFVAEVITLTDEVTQHFNMDQETPLATGTKRKILNPDNWVKNKRKKARLQGEPSGTSKIYLQEKFNTLKDVFENYKSYCSSHDTNPAARKTFEIFFYNSNLSLFTPKKDLCNKCVAHKNGVIDDISFDAHNKKKTSAKQEKEMDKSAALAKKIIMLTNDAQAIKSCPQTDANVMYFHSKLTIHNNTIYNVECKECKNYIYTEMSTSSCASTYVSCICDFIHSKCRDSNLPIVIWCDNCLHQNKNIIYSNALLALSKKLNVEITLKYLEVGHTFLEVDSAHSNIERKSKNVNFYIPEEFVKLVREARTVPFPYEAVLLDHTFFLDYTTPSAQFYKTLRPPPLKIGDEVIHPKVTDLVAINHRPDGRIYYKVNHTDDWKQLRETPKPVPAIVSYPRLHKSVLPIDEIKYKHLQDIKKTIPRCYHEYYDNLPYKTKKTNKSCSCSKSQAFLVESNTEATFFPSSGIISKQCHAKVAPGRRLIGDDGEKKKRAVRVTWIQKTESFEGEENNSAQLRIITSYFNGARHCDENIQPLGFIKRQIPLPLNAMDSIVSLWRCASLSCFCAVFTLFTAPTIPDRPPARPPAAANAENMGMRRGRKPPRLGSGMIRGMLSVLPATPFIFFLAACSDFAAIAYRVHTNYGVGDELQKCTYDTLSHLCFHHENTALSPCPSLVIVWLRTCSLSFRNVTAELMLFELARCLMGLFFKSTRNHFIRFIVSEVTQF
ncbi:hypothetical protein B566_EDAN017890, partial [Ephemera danica]